MKCFFALFNCLRLFATYSIAQSNQLTGVLIDQGTCESVANASVTIPNVGSARTASNSQFVIKFANCQVYTLENRVEINIYHSDYGYDLSKYIFDRTYTITTLYIELKNSVQVIGRVFNKTTNDFLGGIQVTCQLNIAGFNKPTVITDNFWKFKFIFSQQLVGRVNFINLYFRDTLIEL